MFTQLAQPWALLPDDRAIGSSSASAANANNTYITAATLEGPATVTGFRYRTGAGGNGNCDLGIYDARGKLLAHTGLTPTATGIRTVNLSTPSVLSPGKYYLAFWIDNAVDTIYQNFQNNGLSLCSYAATGAGGLPTTIAPPLANLGNEIGMIGLLSGGWS